MDSRSREADRWRSLRSPSRIDRSACCGTDRTRRSSQAVGIVRDALTCTLACHQAPLVYASGWATRRGATNCRDVRHPASSQCPMARRGRDSHPSAWRRRSCRLFLRRPLAIIAKVRAVASAAVAWMAPDRRTDVDVVGDPRDRPRIGAAAAGPRKLAQLTPSTAGLTSRTGDPRSLSLAGAVGVLPDRERRDPACAS